MSANLKFIDERQPTDGDEIPLTRAARVAVMKGGHDQVVDSQSVQRAAEPGASCGDMIAFADVSRRLAELARRVALSDCTVLIAGESGAGKEVLARFIHRNSPRAAKPFIAVNCAAIPENMLEAILFGYERGAFTGAHASHAGKFEQAQAATLLLDEVTEMPLGLQAKILRVLQEREVERLGGRSPVAIDVRVLATTNRDLRAEVSAGRFREDLYYRLNVFPLATAPLRQRRDDVLPLAMRLLTLRCRAGERIPALSADAAHLLLTYGWPGNVRELDNVMQRALILASGPVIEQEHVQLEEGAGGGIAFSPRSPFRARSQSAPGAGHNSLHDLRCTECADAAGVWTRWSSPGREEERNGGRQAIPQSSPLPAGEGEELRSALSDSLGAAERELILGALRTDHGNRRAAAKRLGVSPRTLRYKLAKLRDSGIQIPAAGRAILLAAGRAPQTF